MTMHNSLQFCGFWWSQTSCQTSEVQDKVDRKGFKDSQQSIMTLSASIWIRGSWGASSHTLEQFPSFWERKLLVPGKNLYKFIFRIAIADTAAGKSHHQSDELIETRCICASAMCHHHFNFGWWCGKTKARKLGCIVSQLETRQGSILHWKAKIY